MTDEKDISGYGDGPNVPHLDPNFSLTYEEQLDEIKIMRDAAGWIPPDDELREQVARIIRSADGMRGGAPWGGTNPKTELAEPVKNLYRSKADQIIPLIKKAVREEMARESVLKFAGKMETVLKRNDYKGGWDNCEVKWLRHRLLDELDEWVKAQRTENETDELIDIANFCMMICENLEALKEQEGK